MTDKTKNESKTKETVAILDYEDSKDDNKETKKKNGEETVEKIAKELQLVLPKINEPLGVRIVALLSLVAGLGLLARMMSDVFDAKVPFYLIFTRVVGGLLLLGISYGLVKRRRWPVWVLGAVVLIGAFVNPGPAMALLIIFLYLWAERNSLKASLMDVKIEKTIVEFKKWFKDNLG
ncbi:MAG: hypothetical protein COV29_00650 [Candidatus Yanofskybacteria bacterium CG10_big_fil_rev_8_21_14_0_10_36_16]|uniref:Uncharacterized protein n=1 Tax=Candidatus Yanofskybacteria bacterium CG10_big_fil_rev_8_21_14_0_10_36_16 TaxID=1975096 RepID=A0A2J0Q8R7_9BACT|nr:MAG: hypothetical protein COV29_00650 [Candidatus Yanofskybacteria bacterium CG10_big_fil_rev_8_21_14_0_10_36_16]